jgi:hypothetical protein
MIYHPINICMDGMWMVGGSLSSVAGTIGVIAFRPAHSAFGTRIVYGVLRNDVDGTVLTTATLGSQPQRAEVGSCDGRSKRATGRVRGSSVS